MTTIVIICLFVGACVGALLTLIVMVMRNRMTERGELPGNEDREWREGK